MSNTLFSVKSHYAKTDDALYVSLGYQELYPAGVSKLLLNVMLNMAYSDYLARILNSEMHALNGNIDQPVDSVHKFFLINGKRVYCILCPDGKFRPYLGNYCEDYASDDEGVVVSSINEKRFWMNLRWFSGHKSNICGRLLRDCKICLWMKAKALSRALDPGDVAKYDRDSHVYNIDDIILLPVVTAQSGRDLEAHEIFEYLRKKNETSKYVGGVRKPKKPKFSYKDRRQAGRDAKEKKAQIGFSIKQQQHFVDEFLKWIPYVQFLRALVSRDWTGLLLCMPLVVGSDKLIDFYYNVLEIINPDDERVLSWRCRVDENSYGPTVLAQISFSDIHEKLSSINGFTTLFVSRIAKLSVLPILKVVFQMDNDTIAKFYTLTEPIINSLRVISNVNEAIEIVGDMIDGVMPALITGDVGLLKIETGVVRWIKEALELKGAFLSSSADEELLEANYTTLKQKSARYASDKVYGMTILKLSAELDQSKKVHMSQKLVGSQRATPFACAIVGSPGVGKTFVTRNIAASFMMSKGKRLGEKDIYIWSNAKFANGYTNQPVILLDDIGNLLPDKLKDAPSLSIHEMINSVIPMAPKASVEEKQTTPLVADMYIATSNDWDLGFQFQYTNLESCYRRFPLKIFLTAKPEYCLEGSKELDNSKVISEKDKMMCQNFTIFEWSGSRYVQKLTYFDLPSFLDFFEGYVQNFHEKQNRVLQGHVLCAEHGLPAIGCARCYKGERLQPSLDFITNIGNVNLMEAKQRPVGEHSTRNIKHRFLGKKKMPTIDEEIEQNLIEENAALKKLYEEFPDLKPVQQANAQIGFPTFDEIKNKAKETINFITSPYYKMDQGLKDINVGVKLLQGLDERIQTLDNAWRQVFHLVVSAAAAYVGFMTLKAVAYNTFHLAFKTIRFVATQGSTFSDMSIEGARHYMPSFNGTPDTIRPGLNDPDIEKRLMVSTYDLRMEDSRGKTGRVCGIAVQGDLILTVGHFFQEGSNHRVVIDGEYFPLLKPGWVSNDRDLAVARCPGLPVRHQTLENFLSKNKILSTGFVNYMDRSGWHKAQSGFTENVKSNLDGRSYEVLTYPGQNYDGMCGNPVLVDVAGKWVFYGIHNFGSELNHATRFDLEDLRKVAATFKNVSSMATVAQGGIKILSKDREILMRRGVGHLVFAHCEGLVQYVNKRNTDFKPTPYRQAIVDAGFPEFGPANSTGKMIDGEYTHPGLSSAWKYTSPSNRLSQYEIDAVIQCLFLPYLRENLKHYSVLGNTEALTGVYSSQGMTGLNVSTSGGYGFPGGKSAWLVKDHTGSKISKMLASILDEQESVMKTGTAIKYQCIANAKDELLKKEKLEKNKFRIFQVMPQTCVILARKALLSIIGQFTSKPLQTHIGIGANCFSEDWDKIANYISVHRNIWCADVSGWDTSLTVLPDVCDAILTRLQELEVSGEDYNFVKAAFGSLNQFFTTSLGVSISASKGMISGHPFTAMGNSLCHVFLIMVCAFRGGIKDYQTFRKEVSLVVYGDDSLISVTNTKFVNPSIHTQVFAEAGMELQREDKKVGPIEFCSIAEATFLKRRFKKFGEIWLAPLDMTSIGKSLQFVRKGPIANIERVCAENSLKELVFHGPNEFERVRKILLKWHPDLPSFENVWSDFINKRSDYKTWDTQFVTVEEVV